MYICTHIHTHTSFRNHDSNGSNSNSSLQGFFPAFPHSLFVCPFFLSEDSGSTISNTFIHLLNLLTHLIQFRTVLPIPLQKAKPTKKSSVFVYASSPTPHITKGTSPNTLFTSYLNSLLKNPLQCDCYSSEIQFTCFS